MDELRGAFWRLFDQILWTLDQEHVILQELFDEDDYEDEVLMPHNDVVRDLNGVLEAVIGRFLQEELMIMADDDEDLVELIYGRDERLLDWRDELPRMDYLRSIEDPYFLQHFRMDRFIMERLIVWMGNHLVQMNRLHRLRTGLDKCLLMGLWILANLDTFRAIGVVFGVPRGTVHFHYCIVIEALRELAPKFIKWPSAPEREEMKRRIQERRGYPGIVGLIDGTLIRITAPSIQKERYIDRHQSYSLNVLAVCDDSMIYRDIYVGNPGSVNDIRVFQRSALHDFFLERQDVVAENEHIIGDGGFELTNKLLVPFRDLGNLTPRQRLFNYVHSSIRMTIERSFGMTKGKWRRLIKLYTKKFEYSIDHIVACFVLHNFVLLEGREANGMCIMQPQQQLDRRDFEDENEDEIRDAEPEDEDAIRGGGPEEPANNAVLRHPLLREAKRLGTMKRDQIADLMTHNHVN